MQLPLVLPPPRTLLEVFKMLPEGTRAELIDNTLYMSPAPTTNHQDVIVSLLGQLYNYSRKRKIGKAYVSPIDVYLDDKNAFQPDLVFILASNLSIIKEDGIYGAPDLVIEVLSPGTKTFDLTRKKANYEKSGVKEYWAVDPSLGQSVGYKLTKGKFIEFKREKRKLSSALLKHTFKF